MNVASLEPVHGPLELTLDSLTGPALVIRDKVFYPTGPNQTAIRLTWPTVESSINTTVILENCVTAPGNGYSWTNHIHLTNAWNAQIRGCNTIGPSGLVDPVSWNGIILDGTSTGVTISRHRASGLMTAIWIKGECEGTKIDDLDAVGCFNGIVAWPDSGGGEPGLWITNTHINATQWGIHLRDRYQVFLRDVLLYGGDYYAATKLHPFYGVVAEDCRELYSERVKVSNNGAEAKDKPIVPFAYNRCEATAGEPERTKW